MSIRKKISQREALRLRKRVRELEQQLSNLDSRYPSGVHVDEVTFSEIFHTRLHTARKFANNLLLVHQHDRVWSVVATNVREVRP